jgi:hypothetical protein
LTQAVLARVPILIDQGRNPAEIADEIGCTLDESAVFAAPDKSWAVRS